MVDKRAKQPVRISVADDEAGILDSYRMILDAGKQAAASGINDLKFRLCGKKKHNSPPSNEPAFDVVHTNGAEAAVVAVRESRDDDKRFAVAFLDMRIPPGPDRAGAAAEIRKLEPRIDFVISTAYSDADPVELSRHVFINFI